MNAKAQAISALLIMVLLLTGCGGDETSSKRSPEGGTEPTTASSADAESLETQLQEQYGDTDWFARIDHIANVTKLRHPVVEIHFADTVNDVRGSYMNDVQAAVSSIIVDDYFLEIYGSDGAAGGMGSASGESVELPTMPVTIDDLAGWMEEAYGTASGDPVEDWYPHIIGYDFQLDQWDGERVIVVKTDLADVGYGWSPERAMVDLIKYAVSSAGIDWATDLRIEDAAEENLSTSEYRSDMIPYRGY